MADQVEHVMVIPTRVFHELGHFQGFSGDVYRYLPAMLSPANISYRPRPEAEKNENYKQLIPYVIFRHVSPAGAMLFAYTRGKGQGESRLHLKRSIGIGGHISSADAFNQSPYSEGMGRELAEEVAINSPHEMRIVGLINDDQTEVGRVHLGVVHLVDVATPDVLPLESSICDAGFVPVAELVAEMGFLESWSQFCLQAIARGDFDAVPPPDAE